ncbi:HTTM domain-containing protein [Calycomorphotria hydatis]|uniref:Vitamin K-dependent gamma-carboxylase n=1 Tax=Calycomorphotria hydatis TaxID=2528027 RepID=A0A517T8W2_9PLAN|nr:HTTM domain-containing protein [Calycomorphotria hydatis]QDT64815.1 Vitamin K-dependent gamma-carboxylase [Calycomorphotria hydatis]
MSQAKQTKNWQDFAPVAAWNKFFFAQEVPYALAITRIFLPLVIFADLGRRWPNIRELFSTDGATAPLWINYGFANAFPELPGEFAVAAFTVLMFLLLAVSLGWMTRLSLILVTILYFYFTNLDSISTITKYTAISCHMLLFLSMSDCGSVWSIDSWLKGTKVPPKSSVWPRRMIQLTIGIIYFAAAMTKIHTATFFSGEQMMYWMLTHLNNGHPMGEYLAMMPVLLVASAYTTVVWEMLFLFTAWQGWGRRIMVGLGVMFHGMTIVGLGLFYFPLIFYSLYFSFLSESDIVWFRKRILALSERYQLAERVSSLTLSNWGTPISRLGWMAPAAYALLLPVIGFGGIVVERQVDPYNQNSPDGPMPLPEMSANEVRRMLQPSGDIKPIDYFFTFQTGDTLVGNYLLSHKTEFSTDDKVIAQIIMQPAHPDVWLECHLVSSQGTAIIQRNMVVPREALRQTLGYQLDPVQTPPGQYTLELYMAGEHLATRTINVTE